MNINVLDIETSPIVAYVWGLKDQNITLNQIVKDWKVLAWSAIGINQSINKIVYHDLRKNYGGSDKSILIPLHKLLSETDILITHNGKEFDAKKLNARFIHHGMRPVFNYKHFDTWILVKQVAAFTSTKLEYVTDRLNQQYKKLTHLKFPGMSLWNECLKGNIAAWNEMKSYNIQDTLSTRELALLLKDWAPKAFPDFNAEKCLTCGKIKRVKLKCNECGKWGIKI